jgi:hypothetical protein
MMKALRFMVPFLAAGLLLAGCGGGGGGDAFVPPAPRATLTIAPLSASLPSNRSGVAPALNSPFSTQVNVRMIGGNGAAVPDGSLISLRVDNTSVGLLSIPDDPSTPDVNEFSTLFAVVPAPTSGGLATFFFHSGVASGSAVLTASAVDPVTGVNITATFLMSVTVGPEPVVRLSIQPESSSILSNRSGVRPQLGSPFNTQVSVRFVGSQGAPVADGTAVNLRVSDFALGALSTLDDPVTPEDDFEVLRGAVSAETVGGLATFFFHSRASAGSVTLTASGTDPATGEQQTAVFTMAITAGPDPIVELSIVPVSASLPSNRSGFPPEQNSPFTTQVNVRFVQPDGTAAIDGTEINLRVDNLAIGSLSTLDDFTTLVGSATAETVGGFATFFFHSGAEAGTTTLTAAVAERPGAATLTASFVMTVTVGPEPFERLTVEAVRTVLPPNTFGVRPFLGSPFISEVIVTRRRVDGSLISGGLAEDGEGIAVSINPVTSGAFSTLDDPETEDEEDPDSANEFLILLGQGPVDVVAGKATLFFHSFGPGQSTMTVTAVDPDTGANLSAQVVFTITDTAPALPSELSFLAPAPPLYVPESGGASNYAFQVFVDTGNGIGVPDPVTAGSAVNNIQLEILQDGAAGGETVTTIDANGSNNEGRLVKTRTFAGIASGVFRAGTRQGNLAIRATADRRDNNVDNGIQEPVITQQSLVISDGKLFSLQITIPDTNALRINRVAPGIQIDSDELVPPDPDGTYSLTVSAIGLDRQGNPVLPGTPIAFGLVDSPITGFPTSGAGSFVIAGGDGNPEEAGTGFTAPSGQFQSAGGGAGPGDTILVFGEESTGNRDLESARTVESINSQTSLSVTTRFNRNDDTGQIVDNGPVLPYLIGRATIGNISSAASTDELGVATTTLNYPTTSLGHVVALWARGIGDTVGGVAEQVTDAELIVYPGVAPATVVVSPSVIPANTTQTVTICVFDAAAAAVQGFPVGFQFTNPPSVATVDGIPLNGVVAAPTGANGCTTATVTTSGIATAGTVRNVIFSAGGSSGTVTIAGPEISILQAFPSSFIGTGGRVNLRLVDGNGQPISGVFITATCVASGGAAFFITEPPGITDEDGRTSSLITTSGLIGAEEVGSGVCTFRAAGGQPFVDVQFIGVDICRFAFSPSC